MNPRNPNSWRHNRCWPLVHLNAGDGTTRCGRTPPAALIAWTGITCPDCTQPNTQEP